MCIDVRVYVSVGGRILSQGAVSCATGTNSGISKVGAVWVVGCVRVCVCGHHEGGSEGDRERGILRCTAGLLMPVAWLVLEDGLFQTWNTEHGTVQEMGCCIWGMGGSGGGGEQNHPSPCTHPSRCTILEHAESKLDCRVQSDHWLASPLRVQQL